MPINTRKFYILVITWGFPFIHKVRNDGKNKGIDGNSSLFVTSSLHSKIFIKLYDANETIYETETESLT